MDTHHSKRTRGAHLAILAERLRAFYEFLKEECPESMLQSFEKLLDER